LSKRPSSAIERDLTPSASSARHRSLCGQPIEALPGARVGARGQAHRRAAHMYLPPVTIAYSQKAPITRQTPTIIERSTQRIILWPLAVMLRPCVDGPQPDAGASSAQCGIGDATRNGGGRQWGARRHRCRPAPAVPVSRIHWTRWDAGAGSRTQGKDVT